jgi:hypothetical protein
MLKDLRFSLPSLPEQQPATNDVQYEETIEVPAIHQESSYSGVSPWPTQKWTPPPYWQNLLPRPKGPIDFEKLGFRVIVACFAFFTIIMTIIMLGKILAAVSAVTIR